ncbi:MAG: anti-sigma factor domain-containing protein [Nocardioides sp.]
MNPVTSDTMSAHPDLLGLLRGELSNAEVSLVDDHLYRCPDCRDSLGQVAVGHALLTSAGRTLTTSTPVAPIPEPAPLDTRNLRRSNRMGWARPTLMLAAAAVLVAGTAGVTATLTRSNPTETPIATPPSTSPPTTAPAVQTAALEPVDGNGSGEILMAGERNRLVDMTIQTKGLPKLPRGQFYFAWLLDPNTNKMVTLGQIGPSGKVTFTLPVGLLSRYSAVDISLERDDGDPQHSITSVLRAEYTPNV